MHVLARPSNLDAVFFIYNTEMPELPEVHTTATYLNKAVKNRIIKDVWTDWPKYFRAPKGKIRQSAESFKKKILGRKILSVGRKGKNILFRLSGGYTMLAHQKMTGHFLVGRWHKNGKFKSQNKKLNNVWLGQKWVPVDRKGPLGDDRNRFIRLIFFSPAEKCSRFRIYAVSPK